MRSGIFWIVRISSNKYKVKDQLGEWTGSGTIRGRVGSAGNPAEQAKQYEILVDRKNLEQARFAIQK